MFLKNYHFTGFSHFSQRLLPDGHSLGLNASTKILHLAGRDQKYKNLVYINLLRLFNTYNRILIVKPLLANASIWILVIYLKSFYFNLFQSIPQISKYVQGFGMSHIKWKLKYLNISFGLKNIDYLKFISTRHTDFVRL